MLNIGGKHADINNIKEKKKVQDDDERVNLKQLEKMKSSYQMNMHKLYSIFYIILNNFFLKESRTRKKKKKKKRTYSKKVLTFIEKQK